MPFQAYMKIKDVPGECTDDKHKEWIEILSYTHGVNNMVSSSTSSGGGGSEGCEHSDFSIVKVLDKASAKLNLACCRGAEIGDIEIELCKSSGDNTDEQVPYMKYKMEGSVKVTSVRPGGSSQGGDVKPMEEVCFAYDKITWTYDEQDEKGKSKGKIEANWDKKKNKGG